MRNLGLTIWHIPRNAVIALITVYQHTLSPDHGPLRHLHTYGYCRHDPSCSEHAKQVLHRYGFVIGALLGLRQILSCHPFRPLDDAATKKLLRSVYKEPKSQ